MDRRKVITTLSLSLFGIAGCSGTGQESSDSETRTDEEVSRTPLETENTETSPTEGKEVATELYYGESYLDIERVENASKVERSTKYEELTKEQRTVFDTALANANAQYDDEFDFGNRTKIFVKKESELYVLRLESA